MSDWLSKDTTATIDEVKAANEIDGRYVKEMEIQEECSQSERNVLEIIQRRDMMMEAWRGKRIVRELIDGLVVMVPELAAEKDSKRKAAEEANPEDRRMIADMVSEMTDGVPGFSLAEAISWSQPGLVDPGGGQQDPETDRVED